MFFLEKKEKAFTLIELMVVVAIIGLLVALSLLAIKNYRNKGQDAAIQTELLSVRNVAGLEYEDNPDGFLNVCKNGTLTDEGNLGNIRESIEKKGGSLSCKSTKNGYAIVSTLKAVDCWCVDSTGASREITLGGGETCESVLTGTTCPE